MRAQGLDGLTLHAWLEFNVAQVNGFENPATQDRRHALSGQRLVADKMAHNLLALAPSIGGEHIDPPKHGTLRNLARQQSGR